jgi:PAS domain S-box-containing protein
MWLLSSEDRQCIAVNQAALSLYGYTQEEFMALPRNAPPFAPGAAIANSTATWHRTKSGAAVAVELHARAVELGVRRGEVFAAYDVTQRVFSQQATAHAADAYQALLVAAADGIWVLDEQFNLIDVNEAYCRMSGYTRDELLKLSPSQLEKRTGDEATIRLEQWRAAEQAGASTGDKSCYQAAHLRKDGTEYPVEVSVGGMTGARTRTVVVVRDATARLVQNESELAQRQLEHKAQQRRVDALQNALQLHRVASTLDEPALIRRALELAAAVTDSPLAYASALDAAHADAHLLAVFDRARGPAQTIDTESNRLTAKGVAAQSMRSAQPLTVTDEKNAERHDALPSHATALIVPIVEGDKCLGAIAVAGREAVYGAEDRQALAPLIDAIGSILAAKRAHAHTSMLAQTAEMALKGLLTNLSATSDRR